MYLLGLDVGTSAGKAIVFDLKGNIVGQGFVEYEIIQNKAGWLEQDALSVWTATKLAIKQALKMVHGKTIEGISVSVQGDGVIPVDKRLFPLCNAVLGGDYRAIRQSENVSDLFDIRHIFHITGMRPHPLISAIKILWIRENRPDIYAKTFKFMSYGDFILSQLGSEIVIDYTMASRTMVFDLHQRRWSREILTAVGIDMDLLSNPVPSGTVVGQINPSIAAELGMSRQCLLVTGGMDQACAALGAGILKEGVAVDSHGTAEILTAVFCKPLLSDLMFENFYPCNCYVKEDMYYTFSFTHTGGLLLKWYRDNIGYPEVEKARVMGINAYEAIIADTGEMPSPLLVLPHFNGSGTPYCDLTSKGAIIGLSILTTRNHIAKAILESLAFELRLNIDAFGKAGLKIAELRAVGGAAKSSSWLQLKADVSGYPLAVPKVRDAACLGAAILAGCALGGYNSLNEGISHAVSVTDTYYPRESFHDMYQDRYNVYKDLYPTLKEINRKLHAYQNIIPSKAES